MFKSGYIFTPFEAPEQSPFDKLFDVFSELITHTSGDVDEALDWLNILDKEYSLTSDEYTMDDFIEDLKKKGYRVKMPWIKFLVKSEKAVPEITNLKKVVKEMN
jgi:hypothetical protein